MSGDMRAALDALCYRIHEEGATPLDWPEFRAAIDALDKQQPEQPVAEVLIDSCADHQSLIEAMAYLPAGTMLYASPQARQAVPAGFVLVPVEPTPEMLDAASLDCTTGSLRGAWRDMLAARPQAEQGGEG